MSKCVILREDEADLAALVSELLGESGYTVIHVTSVQDLLIEASRRAPCVALVDGTSPSSFDLWWIGSVLSKLGVPSVAFTAHASAREEFATDPHGFVGVVSKPFDADDFVNLVDSICWEEPKVAVS
jgi:DNA-binding NtrC family response regulator